MKYLVFFLLAALAVFPGCLNKNSDDTTIADISGTATGTAYGVIHGSDGNPASGVIVSAYQVGTIAYAAPQRVTNDPYFTATDNDGYYAFNNIPQGMYTIVAKKTDHLQACKANVSVKQNTITDLGQIDLTITGNISGIVTKHGKPLVDIDVVILGTSYRCNTTASGAYTFSNIPQGTYTITALYPSESHGGFIMASKQVTITGGQTTTAETIELHSGFYVTAGPNNLSDLTNGGAGWDPASMSFDFYFSEPPYSTTKITEAISISPNDKSYTISTSMSGTYRAQVTFTPSAGFAHEFEYGTTYTVTLGTTLTSSGNTPLASQYSFSFTTKAPASTAIKKILPSDLSAIYPDQSLWSMNGHSIMVYFTGLMDRSSIEESSTMKNSSGTAISCTYKWTTDSYNDLDIVEIYPAGDSKNTYAPTHLAENETYTVTIAGKTFAKADITSYAFSFKTGPEGEYIKSNTTWSGSKTISVPVYITPGVTLTVSAGTVLTFEKGSYTAGSLLCAMRNQNGGNSNRGKVAFSGTSTSHISCTGTMASYNSISIAAASTITYTDFKKINIITANTGTGSTDGYSITRNKFSECYLTLNDTNSSAATNNITNNTIYDMISGSGSGITYNTSAQTVISLNDIQHNYTGITINTASGNNLKLTDNNIMNNSYYNIYMAGGTVAGMTASGNYLGTSTAATISKENYVLGVNPTVSTGWYTSSKVSTAGQ